MKLIASLTSPYARKIQVILAEKGLPYQPPRSRRSGMPDSHVPQYNLLGKVLRRWSATVGHGSTPAIAEHPNCWALGAGDDSTTASLALRQTEALADGITDAAVAAFLGSQSPDEAAATLAWRQREDPAGPEQRGFARVEARDGLNGDAVVGDVAAGCALACLDPAPADHRLAPPPP